MDSMSSPANLREMFPQGSPMEKETTSVIGAKLTDHISPAMMFSVPFNGYQTSADVFLASSPSASRPYTDCYINSLNGRYLGSSDLIKGPYFGNQHNFSYSPQVSSYYYGYYPTSTTSSVGDPSVCCTSSSSTGSGAACTTSFQQGLGNAFSYCSYGNSFDHFQNPAPGKYSGGYSSSTFPPGLSTAQSSPTNGPDRTPERGGGRFGDNSQQLELFAEHFKQRRIKLGVTQADVGAALAHLNIHSVGALSQSTICRFESLTLSHNNMMALKPILEAWLEEAEKAAYTKQENCPILPNQDKKRKRTSIGTLEKRTLEEHFSLQARPSSERIASIAESLGLAKNVVRVWFCNQRQKTKRMKFNNTP